MSEEVRIVDPKTGGAKGAKPEDYSQVPPLPLYRTLNELELVDARYTLSPVAAFTYFLESGRDEYLLAAAAGAIRAMGSGIRGGLDAVARVYRYGGAKYDAANWARGYSHRLSIAAAWRHLVEAAEGEKVNYEEYTRDGMTYLSSEHPLAHFVFHCFTLYEFRRRGLGTDDILFFEDRYGKGAE